MTYKNAELIAEDLIGKFGIPLSFQSGRQEGYPYIDIRPNEMKTPYGFNIRIQSYWRRFSITFIPDNYARDLIRDMGKASIEKRMAFKSFAQSALDVGGKIEMKIDGSDVDPLKPEEWPTDWNIFSLSLEKMGVDLDQPDSSSGNEILVDCTWKFTGLVISLLPLDKSIYEEALEVIGLPEGAKVRIEVNRYERSKLNREACIVAHGLECKACGIRFDKKYGKLGEGYINVHHITPVSELGEGKVVDPVKDLVPVCPNCHAMLHRENPPIQIEKLRESLQKSSSQASK